MSLPRVTVICLCYNQARFVREAILSVLSQTYSEIQLLVVDDASTDNSVSVIKECVASYPQINFIPLSKNSGNCKAFNLALLEAEGEFVIDFAADDVLLPDRISRGVAALTSAGDLYGVNFTDAEWIAEDGRGLYRHSVRFPHKIIPEGDVYKDLVERFFICSPTMMFRRKVIESLGGYDESLSYEDFDFWIRSSRNFYYCYTPEVLVKKRIVRNSMSQIQFRVFSPQLRSTLVVCEKIMALNKNRGEQKALAKRILYEMGVCLRLLNLPLAFTYWRLYFKNRGLRY
jgi:glycosyltransferase involved in cell wall biosynthesis